jgi:hypothetical protein
MDQDWCRSRFWRVGMATRRTDGMVVTGDAEKSAPRRKIFSGLAG